MRRTNERRQQNKQHDAFEGGLVQLAWVTRRRSARGKYHGPGHISRTAPQFAVDEIGNATKKSPIGAAAQVLSLLLILPFNAWFLDRFLSSKTPREDTLPRWFLGLRLPRPEPATLQLSHDLALEKVPGKKGARGDAGVLPHRLPGPFQEPPAAGLRAPTEGVVQIGLPLRLDGGQPSSGCGLGCLVGGRDMAGRVAPPLGSWRVRVSPSRVVCVHGPAFPTRDPEILHNRMAEGPSLDRALLLALCQFRGMVAGFAIFLFASPTQNSLSWKIHAGRTGVNRDPLWQGLQGRLQRQWGGMPWFTQWRRPMGLSRTEGPGREDAEIVALYRLKTLLLVLESAGLTVLICRVPSRSAVLSTAIRPAFWVAVALAGTGSTIQVVGLLARLFRVSALGENLSRHPYGRYLLLTQTAFVAGIYGAMVLMQASIEQFGLLLCLSAALCAIMTVFFFLLPAGASPKGPDLALWGLLYLVLAALGGLIALEGEGWRSTSCPLSGSQRR